MTAAPRPAAFPRLADGSRGDDGTGPGAGSCGILCGARPFDPWRLKAQIPLAWHRFVRAAHGSQIEVQFFYGVSERTAEYWWNGGLTSATSAWAVVRAQQHFPEVFAEHFGAAA